MNILPSKKTAEFLETLTYLDTQLADIGIDLTVGSIYEIENKGEIDFGGDERKDAEISKIEPELRDPNDDYGWWELEPKTYFLEYNENLKKERLSILQPLNRLTRNSATHPTMLITDLKLVPLFVGGEGIAIKENSRISRIFILEY